MAYVKPNVLEINTKKTLVPSTKTPDEIRTNRKKKNTIVILIDAENPEELKAIKKAFHLLAERTTKKMELGYYIAPVGSASFETIKDFGNFSLEISTGNR